MVYKYSKQKAPSKTYMEKCNALYGDLKPMTPEQREFAMVTYDEDMTILGKQRGKKKIKYSILCPIGQRKA